MTQQLHFKKNESYRGLSHECEEQHFRKNPKLINNSLVVHQGRMAKQTKAFIHFLLLCNKESQIWLGAGGSRL
jgi:hypothetical protein